MGTEGKNENNIKTGKLLSVAPVLILIVMAVLTAGYCLFGYPDAWDQWFKGNGRDTGAEQPDQDHCAYCL